MCVAFEENPSSAEGEFPSTHDSLVEKLKLGPGSPDFHKAIKRFLDDYRPALYRRLRQGGMDPDRAKEILQIFFVECCDPQKAPLSAYDGSGRFRHFLLKCLKFRMLTWIRDEKARAEHGATSLSPDEEDERDLSEVLAHPRVMEPDEDWDRIWFWQTFQLALESLANRQEDPADARIVRELIGDPFNTPSMTDFTSSLNQARRKNDPLTLNAVQLRKQKLTDEFALELLSQIGREYAEGKTPPDAVKQLLSLLARRPPKRGIDGDWE